MACVRDATYELRYELRYAKLRQFEARTLRENKALQEQLQGQRNLIQQQKQLLHKQQQQLEKQHEEWVKQDQQLVDQEQEISVLKHILEQHKMSLRCTNTQGFLECEKQLLHKQQQQLEKQHEEWVKQGTSSLSTRTRRSRF